MSHGLNSEVCGGGVSATPTLGAAAIFSKTDPFGDKSDYLSHPLFSSHMHGNYWISRGISRAKAPIFVQRIPPCVELFPSAEE